MTIIEKSANRVRRHTADAINTQIECRMRNRIAYFADHPDEIDARLNELDCEWDIERWLEMNSSGLSLLGLFLGALTSRKWLLLPAAVQTFFLQHGIQGWCPPLPMLRRLGIRTQSEIETEREALKAIRGDVEVDKVACRADFVI